MHCNLKATRPDVAPVVLGWFGPNFYCACAETSISELPLEILTLLNLATKISYLVQIFADRGQLPAL